MRLTDWQLEESTLRGPQHACPQTLYACVCSCYFLQQVALWWQVESSLLPLNPLQCYRLCVCDLVPILSSICEHTPCTYTGTHVPVIAYACTVPGSAPQLRPTLCPSLPSAWEHLHLRWWPSLAAPSAALTHPSVLWVSTRCTFNHLFAPPFYSTYRFSCPPAISQSSDLFILDLCVKGRCVLCI